MLQSSPKKLRSAFGPMDKGAALNKRVSSLFERAGFRTEPNSQTTLEHKVELAPGKKRKVDLYAREDELGVTIIASNKSGGIEDTWTGHVNDWEQIGKKAGADTVLFVITGKDLSPEDRAYAAGKGMHIWGEKQLSYYEALVATIRQSFRNTYASAERGSGTPLKADSDVAHWDGRSTNPDRMTRSRRGPHTPGPANALNLPFLLKLDGYFATC